MSQQREEELLALPYRELQARAKDAGLKASGKAEELVQRLLAYEAGEAPPPTTVRKSGTVAKTPRTSRRAAPAAPSPDKAALLRAAASTPLPTAQREQAEEEEEDAAEAEAPRSTRGVRRRLSAQAAAAASPAATPRRPAPKLRAKAGGGGAPVLRALLLTALVAALAALAVPYCQQHDCAELARNLPELASESASRLAAQARSRVASISLPDGAASVVAEARARALAAADVAQAQWAALLARFGKGSSSVEPACQFDAAAALRVIMPREEQYDALRQAAVAALSSGGAEPADKALAALLVCEAADDCHGALHEVEQAVPAADSCLLHLDARHLGADKGALQEQLAGFLSTSPSGLVLLRRVDQMAPELLPVLINALSEQGAFQQAGQPVPTTRATFLLTSLMPDVFAHLSEEIKFKQEAKTRLVVDLALRAADQDAAKSQANALRRRIDFVIPIGPDPGRQAQGEAAAETAGCQLQVGRLLEQLLPSGAEWEGLRASAAGALAKRLGTKAPVALLACDRDEGCDSLAAEVQRASAGPACVLELQGPQLHSSKSHIAEFIRRVPKGTVVLNRVDKLPVELLSVLVEALVPSGSLDPADDAGAVSTVGTTFLLTAHAPHEVFVHMSDKHRFRQDAHLHLASEFQSRATNKQAATILAEALHHRIDTVVPVGSSPAAYEASAAHHAAARRSQGDPSQWEVKPDAAAEADGLVPCSRSASEGTAVLLRRTATEGWRGALLDWLRVGGATRLLVHAGCGMVVKMPPLVLLAQQVIMMALSANPRGYCATPLLSHPLTRRRLHRVWAAFDAVPTVVPHIEDSKPGSEAERALAECMAVLTMQQAVLGVLLPLAIAVAVHSGRHGGAEQHWPPAQQQQQEQQQRAAGCRGWRSRVLAAAAAWRRGWARADDALTSALALDRDELEVSGPQLLLCLWMLLGNAWMLCTAATVRALGDPLGVPGQV
ncbi:hypothetical protein C2E21_0576 isoform B [Chlorella sorokiniana]|uniref:SAP domain-containing protein n=1 Tax=Chlorella sorokiniana TaxID=3076 RepID=A0A2P6U458_CHLSO|nr:hypothetical protein C2E21_0576 isoform B [Chlorella sorokiniana]|eukprot:PRW61089.1 hypothetical protein C2E21_0576 isoform B [Chlorella sorokiniana]